MRLLASLLGLAALVATAPAQAAECENSPYNCRVPNTETHGDPNRKYNDFDDTYIWGLVNQPPIKDGEGGVRGHAKDGTKLNFGQRKTIGGEVHVYAFAVGLAEGGTISGWVPEAAVYRKSTLAKMPTTSPGKPDQGFYETDWVVTGGDLTASGSLALNAKYGNRKVNPNVPADEHEAASDYLVRQWDPAKKTGYVNFLYNLPGVGGMTTDTLPMCVHFRRFKGVNELEIELYFADSSSKSDLSLHFDFGEIDGRRGWMTKQMLTPAQDLDKLAVGHPCRPADPPPPVGAGGAGQGGSDPAGPGGSGGSEAAGSDQGAGAGGDAGGSGGAAGEAGGTSSGTSGHAGGPGGASSGAGGVSSAGASAGGGAAAGAGGKSSGGTAAGAGSPGGPVLDADDTSSDGGCALVSSRAASEGGALVVMMGLGLLARRAQRRRG